MLKSLRQRNRLRLKLFVPPHPPQIPGSGVGCVAPQADFPFEVIGSELDTSWQSSLRFLRSCFSNTPASSILQLGKRSPMEPAQKATARHRSNIVASTVHFIINQYRLLVLFFVQGIFHLTAEHLFVDVMPPMDARRKTGSFPHGTANAANQHID